MTIGILAYGSLLANPGVELAEAIVDRIPVMTPFVVEYARSSDGRDGAPTLVPVPESYGASVPAKILVLRETVTLQNAYNMLYRREVGPKAKPDTVYDDAAQRSKRNAVVIETVHDLAGVSTVSYASLKANIPKVLRADLGDEEKAEILAQLAVKSVTAKAYAAGRDGIRYLADAIRHGIHTPLTDLYKCAVLRLADDAPDLEEARLRIAR